MGAGPSEIPPDRDRFRSRIGSLQGLTDPSAAVGMLFEHAERAQMGGDA